MAHTVGDFIVERLAAWGVTRIFGYSGDGINGVIGALRRREKAGTLPAIQFVQVRHEEMAAFMASAHAKFTGELGVCLSTGGPGATHMLTGLYDAKLDHQPVLAILGQAAATSRGASYQQELNLDRAFADACAYIQEVEAPAAARHILDRAARIALGHRQPAAIVLPNDLQEEAYEEPKQKHGFTRSGVGYARPRVVPHEAELARAAAVLNHGERVAILIGAGASGAGQWVAKVAETLSAGVAKALLGKTVMADDLPYVTGTIGLLGTKPSSDMMTGCDTLLMIGTGFPWSEFLPKDGAARAVQIDIEPSMLGLRYPTEVNLHGDAAETLQALLPLLTQKPHGRWRQGIEDGIRDWWQLMERRAHAKATPVNPQRVVWEMNAHLPANAIVTSDSGSCCNWYARDWRVRAGQLGSLSGGLASMGAAVPYAIAAKFAHPDRPVVALVGDGAMQMNNMAELITVAKYWRGWRHPAWVTCVWNNQDLNQVTWEQRITNGDPKYDGSQDLPDVRYSEFARLVGLNGIFVDDPEQLSSAWARALSSPVPTVIEVKTDPEVAPLPPHITLEQARKFMSTLRKGDPEQGHLLRETVRQVLS